jgi:protoheme IX farnesyltransferase
VLLYTIVLLACSALPFVTRLSGMPYLIAAMVLGAVFLFYAVKIYTEYSDALARRTFRYSILYLTLIFAALLIDHYLQLFF